MLCKQCKKQQKSIKSPIPKKEKGNNNLNASRKKIHLRSPYLYLKGVNNIQK